MLSGADLGFLAAYLGAVVWLGLRAVSRRREGLDDYLLAGRALSFPSFVATMVPSFFGGVLGVGEFTYRYGVSNWLVQGVPYYCFALLYAWLLAGRVRAFPGRTLPDHLESVFGPKVAILAAVWVAVLASSADEMLMLGTVARWATGWPLAACVPLAAAAGLCFLAAGGLRADVWTNRLEFGGMFLGFGLILPFAYKAAGGWNGLAAALPASHLDPSGGNSPGYILTWFFIALWTFVDPAFHQRVCAAKDARTARMGIAASVLFWFIFDFLTTSTGLFARALLPNLEEPLMAYPRLAEWLLPPVVRGAFVAGMCSSILAALAAGGFVASTSLAKDAAGRIFRIPERDQERWVRWGLLATSLASIALALALPSVVGLWYAVGSAAVPGLLAVTLSCYFPSLRIGPGWALAASSLGGGLSAAWLASGWWRGGMQAPDYPWGWEPFYPGLAASLASLAAGRAFGRRA